MASTSSPHLASPDLNPSFTKGVFLGEIREDLVFPFPELTAEERESLSMILDSFRAYAAERIDSARFDHDGQFPDGVRQGLHELGLMGLSIPEAYGGFGASAQGLQPRVRRDRRDGSGALRVLRRAPVDRLQGHRAVRHRGAEADATCRAARRGELVAAFCLTEPGSGSRRAGDEDDRGRSSDDGTHYLLSGTKIWISNAGYADLFTVFAKVAVDVDGKTKERVTAFIVDAHAPGVSLGKREEKMGIKASDTRAVFFDKVQGAGRGSTRRRRAGLSHRARGAELGPPRARRRRRRAARGASCATRSRTRSSASSSAGRSGRSR